MSVTSTTTMINTTNPLNLLGSDFEDTGFCDVWKYYPKGELFAVVLPYDAICSSESSNSGKEAAFMLEFTMYFGLGFLLVIMIQSMQKHRIDWYRLIAFYLVGTIGVPVSNALGADAAGFNRFIGFGVLVHNMAEATILFVLWRGTMKASKSSSGVRLMILYFWIMLVLITFLPLYPLLWAASFQGATLDFFLVTTFCTVAREFGDKGKYFWISFAASVLHIVTIQPLFLGMALGWTALSAPTIIFLVPTFMLYIWFASSDPRAQLTLAQSKQNRKSTLIKQQESIVTATAAATEIVIRNMKSLSQSRNRTRESSREPSANSGNINGGNNNNNNNKSIDKANYKGTTNASHGQADSGIVYVPDNVGIQIPMTNLNAKESQSIGSNDTSNNNNNNNNNNKEIKTLASEGVDIQAGDTDYDDNNHYDVPLDSHGYDSHDQNLYSLQNDLSPVHRTSTGQTIRVNTDTVDHIIKTGLFFSKHVNDPSKLFKWALGIALVGSFLDEIFLITSPCFIDTSFICD